jgi:hypothetical protein
MKTTLIIDDGVMKRLKEEAATRSCTMSELVESALRAFLRKSATAMTAPPELPRWNMGNMLVDISDRDALYRAMEESQ